MTRPSQKVALVTGASRGIGRSIALALAGQGYFIVVNYLTARKAAQQTVAQISTNKGRAQAVQADVRKGEAVLKMVTDIESQIGPIVVLVNNVGEFIEKPLSETSIDEWHNILNSNLSSTFYCCKFALERMRQRRYGRIVNLTGANATITRAFKKIAPYAIAKTGVLILTKSLAAEEAANGITINAISPGFIETGEMSLNEKAALVQKIPMQNLGSPDDVASAVLYLVSADAKYVTGSEIIVSGGWGI